MVHQDAGAILGEGGDGSVHTLDDLPADEDFVLDLVNLRSGSARSERLSGKDEVVRRLGGLHRAVYKLIVPRERHVDAAAASQASQSHRPGLPQPLPPAPLVRREGFLTDFYRHWAAPHVVREERTKWQLMSTALQHGLRTADVEAIMPLLRDGDDIVLALRSRQRLYPVYKFMHGSVLSFGWHYSVCVGDLLQVARVVLETCARLLLFGGIHHGDIKPDNILFRVALPGAERTLRRVCEQSLTRPDGRMDKRTLHDSISRMLKLNRRRGNVDVEFVVADYATAVSRPSLSSIQASQGTPGYMCPMLYENFDRFDADARHLMRAALSLPPPAPRLAADATKWIWDSYAEAFALRARGDLLPDDMLVKNDMYGLGATLLSFEPADPRSTASKAVAQLALKLMSGSMGEQQALWRVSAAQDGVEELLSRWPQGSSGYNEVVQYVALQRELGVVRTTSSGSLLR